MPTCPECGTEPATGRFCGHCGARLPRDRVGDQPPADAWEDRRRPRRGWSLLAGLAVIAAGSVAVSVATDRPAGPGDPALRATVAPATTGPSPAGPRLVMPVRPVTDPGSCMDSRPGCTTWRTTFPDVDDLTRPVAGLDARHLYVGASRTDGTGALYAVDPVNGIQLWRRPLPGPPQRPALAPWGAVVVAHRNRAGATTVRSHDPETGELQWEVGDVLADPAPVRLTAAGRTVVAAGTGRLWFRDLEGATSLVEPDFVPLGLLGSHDAAGATFLVQTDREQVRAYAEDGALRWSRTSSRLATAVEGGRTAVLDAPDHVVGIDVRRGEVWRTRVEPSGDGPLLVQDGTVSLLARTGELVRLSLADGRELARTALPRRDRAGSTIAGDLLLTPSCGGLAAEEIGSGAHLWDLPLGSPEDCAAVPVAAGGDGHLAVAVGRALYGLQT